MAATAGPQHASVVLPRSVAMKSLTHRTCAATAPLHRLRPATNTCTYGHVSASRTPCSRLLQPVVLRSRREQDRLIARVAEAQSPAEAADVSVSIDNKEDADYSVSIAGRFATPAALNAAVARLIYLVVHLWHYICCTHPDTCIRRLQSHVANASTRQRELSIVAI